MVQISTETIGTEEYEIYEREFEEGLPRSPKGKGKRKEVGAKTGSERRRAEIQSAKEERIKEAERVIQKTIDKIIGREKNNCDEALQRYIDWVKNGLNNGSLMVDADLECKSTRSNVKAGGQHQQKNRTAAIVVHTPTQIGVRNEDERFLSQNQQAAEQILGQYLVRHLDLWRQIIRDSSSSFDVQTKVQELAQGIKDNHFS